MVCTFNIRYLCPGMNVELGLELVANVLARLEVCYPRIYNVNTLQVCIQQGVPIQYFNMIYLWEEHVQVTHYPTILIKIFIDELMSDCFTKCILICIPPNFCTAENATNQHQQQNELSPQSNPPSPSDSHCECFPVSDDSGEMAP